MSVSTIVCIPSSSWILLLVRHVSSLREQGRLPAMKGVLIKALKGGIESLCDIEFPAAEIWVRDWTMTFTFFR